MPSKRPAAANPTPPVTPPAALPPKKTGRLSAFLGSQPGAPSRAPLVPPPAPPDPRQIDLVDAVTAADPTSNDPTPAPAPTRRAARAPRRTRSGREQLLVYMHREGIKELKRAVLDDLGENVSDLVCEAVNDWLLKHRRPPVA